MVNELEDRELDIEKDFEEPVRVSTPFFLEEEPKKKYDKSELDARQELFIRYYFDKNNKETFSNGYKSAIKAGYGEEYGAQLITREPEWLRLEKVKRIDKKLLELVDKNLEEDMSMKPSMTIKEVDGKMIEVKDAQLLQVRQKATFFVGKTIGRYKDNLKVEHNASEGLMDILSKVKE